MQRKRRSSVERNRQKPPSGRMANRMEAQFTGPESPVRKASGSLVQDKTETPNRVQAKGRTHPDLEHEVESLRVLVGALRAVSFLHGLAGRADAAQRVCLSTAKRRQPSEGNHLLRENSFACHGEGWPCSVRKLTCENSSGYQSSGLRSKLRNKQPQ
jgi:hypothetical protein